MAALWKNPLTVELSQAVFEEFDNMVSGNIMDSDIRIKP